MPGPCRPIGLLEAKQKEKNGKETRNDRLVGVSAYSTIYAAVEQYSDLNKSMIKQQEDFFIDYNKQEGKEFIPVKWHGPSYVKHYLKERAVY